MPECTGMGQANYSFWCYCFFYRDYLSTFDASYGSYDYAEENIDDTDIDDTDDNID